MKEADQWIKHLTYKYDKKELRDEAEKLGTKITYEEFRELFKKKRESTDGSKSG